MEVNVQDQHSLVVCKRKVLTVQEQTQIFFLAALDALAAQENPKHPYLILCKGCMTKFMLSLMQRR